MGTRKSRYSFSGTVLVYEDGTLAITDSDIKGLIIEVDTFPKLFFELSKVVPHLLELNHGLNDEKISKSELRLKFKFVTETVRQQKNSPLASFPGVLWNNNELKYPLQFA